jgi:hypothetical protein
MSMLTHLTKEEVDFTARRIAETCRIVVDGLIAHRDREEAQRRFYLCARGHLESLLEGHPERR